MEKQRKELENIEDEIPNELPEELLESIDVNEDDKKAKNKKTVFDTTEEEANLEKLNKKLKREERLKKLRELRNTTKKVVEGNIEVELLEENTIMKGMRSNAVSSQKDSWLSRKRIRRA